MRHWNSGNCHANSIEILRKMFEENPGKPTIEINVKCSDCGAEVILAITQTSEGYGLIGGALLKDKDENWLANCADCCSRKKRGNRKEERG